jgi:hypothetical protein
VTDSEGIVLYEIKERRERRRRDVAYVVWNELSGRTRLITMKSEGRNSLIPVYFRREVLKKYYDQPSKYELADGVLRCDEWVLRYRQLDTGHIRVLHKDLALGLPEREQHHWRAHNVALGARYLSMTGRYIPPRCEEHDERIEEFWSSLESTNTAWKRAFGWRLFRRPLGYDAHLFRSLHVPVSQDLTEFDQQVALLAKILCEGISPLVSARTKNHQEGGDKKGPITLLEEMIVRQLSQHPFNAKHWVRPLRVIQDLRSAGAVHRRGSKFRTMCSKYGFDTKQPIQYFVTQLYDVLGTLDILRALAEARARYASDNDRTQEKKEP